MTADFQLYINGQFESGAATFESINPATGEVWAHMPEARTEEVNRAVQAASQALKAPEWAGLTASQRGKLLYKLADLIEKLHRNLPKLKPVIRAKLFVKHRARLPMSLNIIATMQVLPTN